VFDPLDVSLEDGVLHEEVRLLVELMALANQGDGLVAQDQVDAVLGVQAGANPPRYG
jgi:hypothetical protein